MLKYIQCKRKLIVWDSGTQLKTSVEHLVTHERLYEANEATYKNDLQDPFWCLYIQLIHKSRKTRA